MRGMDRSEVWKFIQDNVIALSSVVAGIGIFIWQAITAPARLDPITVAILGLLCLLATSEMVENRRRLDKIQASINEGISHVLTLLPAANVTRFQDSENAMTYITSRIRGARRTVDYASLDVLRSRAKRAQDKLWEARTNSIKAGIVRHRYLFSPSERRVAQVKDWLANCTPGKFFAATCGDIQQTLPMLTFVILDGEELYTRSPYEVGDEEIYISIRHPDVVAVFSQWFDHLWSSAQKIDPAVPWDKQAIQVEQVSIRKS